MSQMKVYNGSTHVEPSSVKYWNGSEWVQAMPKRWTGSAWEELMTYSRFAFYNVQESDGSYKIKRLLLLDFTVDKTIDSPFDHSAEKLQSFSDGTFILKGQIGGSWRAVKFNKNLDQIWTKSFYSYFISKHPPHDNVDKVIYASGLDIVIKDSDLNTIKVLTIDSYISYSDMSHTIGDISHNYNGEIFAITAYHDNVSYAEGFTAVLFTDAFGVATQEWETTINNQEDRNGDCIIVGDKYVTKVFEEYDILDSSGNIINTYQYTGSTGEERENFFINYNSTSFLAIQLYNSLDNYRVVKNSASSGANQQYLGGANTSYSINSRGYMYDDIEDIIIYPTYGNGITIVNGSDLQVISTLEGGLSAVACVYSRV